MASLSRPTIRYGTSSTELLSFFESGKNDAESVSIDVMFLWRLCPPDDVEGMMSSGVAVWFPSSTVTMGTVAGETEVDFLRKKCGGTVFLGRLVVAIVLVIVAALVVVLVVMVLVAVVLIVVVVAVVLRLTCGLSEGSDGSS